MALFLQPVGRPVTRRSVLARVVTLTGSAAIAMLAACGTPTSGANTSSTGAARVSSSATAPATAAGSSSAVSASGAASLSTASTTTVATTPKAAPTAAAPVAGNKTPVVFYHSFNAAQQPRVDSLLVPDARRDLPDITVQITPTKSPYTALQILIAAGSQPDVAMNNGLNPLNMFTDPTPYIARDKFDLTPYNPALLDFMKWQGTLWSLPASVGGNGPIWVFNKTRFDNAAVAYPPDKWDDPAWTWDELVTRTTKLTKKQGDSTTYGFGPMWAWYAHPRPWKAQWMKLDLQTITADTPEMTQAFTMWQEMYSKYGVLPKPGEKPGYNTTQETVLAGASAIKPIIAGNFALYVQQKDVAWALAPIPKGTVTAADLTYFGVGIVAGAKHLDGAWEFARWLATTPDYSLVRQVPPALPRLFAQWLPAVFGDQAVERRAHLIQEAVAFSVPSDGLVYHPKQQEMEQAVNPLMDKVSNGQMTPADMLRQCQTQLTALATAP